MVIYVVMREICVRAPASLCRNARCTFAFHAGRGCHSDGPPAAVRVSYSRSSSRARRTAARRLFTPSLA